jgi:hypothetical protein
MNKISSLKKQIEEEREWGNNNVADLLASDLQAEIERTPRCWLGEQDELQ